MLIGQPNLQRPDVGKGLSVGGRPVSEQLGRTMIVAGFWLYLGALLVWLGIGLLPTVAAHFAPFQHALQREAARQGVWARLAGRIADRSMLMGSLQVVLLQSLFSLLNLGLGLILLRHRVRERICQLIALAVLGTAATFNGPSHQVFHVLGEPPVIRGLHFGFHVVSGTAYLWAVFLFPDGHCPPGWPSSSVFRRAAAAIVTAAVVLITWRSAFLNHPPFFVGFFGALVPVVGLVSMTARLHHPLTGEARQQCRLMRAALIPAAAMATVWVGAWGVSLTGVAAAAAAHRLDGHLETWFPAVFAVVPVMLIVGVLRYRLWDIDVVVSRGLMYGSLTGVAVAAYVVAVSAAGSLASGVWVTALVMAGVALAVDPLRRVLRAFANRVVFGQSMTPAEAMRALADGLERLTPGAELTELTRVAASGTRAAGAELWVQVGEHLLSVARWPEAPDRGPRAATPSDSSLEAWCAAIAAGRCEPVYYRAELLGVLALTLHPGVVLPPAEERLVADLVDHAGLLVQNARLAAQLGRQVETLEGRTDELRLSLQELMATQDAERRLLERNIHDGAQQELVALLLTLRALSRAMASGDPTTSPGVVAELRELGAMTASTASTIERLCGGDLPGVLVEEGPGAMLEVALEPLRRAGLHVEVRRHRNGRAPLEVEAAVYFCCLEGAQNAAKHARSRTLVIDLDQGDLRVDFAVCDDGVGFDPHSITASRGMANLVERLQALGGTVMIESAPGRGTTVRGQIPLAGGSGGHAAGALVAVPVQP